METYHPQLGVTEVLRNYQTDFDALIHTVSSLCNNQDTYPAHKYQLVLEQYITSLLHYKAFPYVLEIEDLNQELSVMWIEFTKQFYENKPKCSLRQYLIKRSMWSLRDWVARELNLMTQSMEYLSTFSIEDTLCSDLEFILHDTTYDCLSLLEPFERYLLWAVCLKNIELGELSLELIRDPATIRSQVQIILDKLMEKILLEAC